MDTSELQQAKALDEAVPTLSLLATLFGFREHPMETPRAHGAVLWQSEARCAHAITVIVDAAHLSRQCLAEPVSYNLSTQRPTQPPISMPQQIRVSQCTCMRGDS